MTKGLTFGLVGNPLRHSLSPLMHNAAFLKLKIKAKYKFFPLEENELKNFFSNLHKNNIRGLNITIPYKERVLKLVRGKMNNAVKSIGATNTVLVDRNGGLSFFNTDYLGFLKHLQQLSLKPKKVAVLGAGGAARAVCFALGKKGVNEVFIYDIDHFRSLSLMKKFNYIFPDIQFRAVGSIEELKLLDKDLLVNASSVGMKKDDPLLINRNMLHKDIFVYDLIYNPKETKLLKLAKETGVSYSNGLGMLLYQGVESLGIWISPKKPPVEVMKKALESAVIHS